MRKFLSLGIVMLMMAATIGVSPLRLRRRDHPSASAMAVGRDESRQRRVGYDSPAPPQRSLISAH